MFDSDIAREREDGTQTRFGELKNLEELTTTCRGTSGEGMEKCNRVFAAPRGVPECVRYQWIARTFVADLLIRGHPRMCTTSAVSPLPGRAEAEI